MPDRQIFFDPQRKRWKRLRRILDATAVISTLVLAGFIFNVLRNQQLPELLLPTLKHNYKALPDRAPLLRSAKSQRPARPLAEPIRQRRLRRGSNHSPILLRSRLQCVVYPQVTQVSPVIKRALSRRNHGPAGHARDLDLLPGEEIGGEDSLRGDGHPAHRRLPENLPFCLAREG